MSRAAGSCTSLEAVTERANSWRAPPRSTDPRGDGVAGPMFARGLTVPGTAAEGVARC